MGTRLSNRTSLLVWLTLSDLLRLPKPPGSAGSPHAPYNSIKIPQMFLIFLCVNDWISGYWSTILGFQTGQNSRMNPLLAFPSRSFWLACVIWRGQKKSFKVQPNFRRLRWQSFGLATYQVLHFGCQTSGTNSILNINISIEWYLMKSYPKWSKRTCPSACGSCGSVDTVTSINLAYFQAISKIWSINNSNRIQIKLLTALRIYAGSQL